MKLHAPQIVIAIWAGMLAIGCTWLAPPVAVVLILLAVVLAITSYEP